MNTLKKLLASLLFALISTSAFAITDNQVFAYAEANYPSVFKGAATAGQYQQYNYRYYPASGNFLAIDTSGVLYVLGTDTGGALIAVGPVASFANLVTAWEATQGGGTTGGTAGTAAACSSGATPAGLNYSQTGNTISVTTTGCIPVPTAGLCNPSAPQATGINVLTTSTLSSFSMTGITFNIPGFPDPFASLGSALAATKQCIVNAPAELSNMNINYNVCYDITSQMASSVSAMQSTGMITVTNPIVERAQGVVTMQTVADCATSGADTITDAFTGKVSVKQPDGSYRQVN